MKYTLFKLRLLYKSKSVYIYIIVKNQYIVNWYNSIETIYILRKSYIGRLV